MTAKPPSEQEPDPVVAWPGWFWWRGVNGMLYARRPLTSPPKLARARTFTALLGEIRRAENGGPGGAVTP